MKLKYLYVSIVAFILSSPLFGATELFVGTHGRDANPGTSAKPFATLARAQNAIRELKAQEDRAARGVTVWTEAGTYYVQDALTPSSTLDRGDRCTWECEIKCGSLVYLRLSPHFSAVLADNLLYKRQPDACSFKLICAVQTLEDAE